MKPKKLLCVAFAATLAFGILGGCVMGSKIDPDEYDFSIEPNKDEQVTIVVSCSTGVEEQAIVKGVADVFNKEYPNVKVDLKPFSGEIAPTIANFYNSELARPGTMPDIIYLNSFDMLALSDKNILLNLDPYINAETKAESFDVSEYDAGFWRLGKRDFKNEQLMVPRSADKVITHVNAKIFYECFKDIPDGELPFTPQPGTKIPANGWTWEQFRQTCRALRKYYDNNGKQNEYLIDSYITWEAVFNPIFTACGARVFDDDGNFALDSTEGKAALDMMKEMQDERWIAPLNTSNANFAGGKGAMMFHSQAATIVKGHMEQTYPSAQDISEYYGMTTFPLIGDSPKIGGGIAGYGIFAGSDKKDYAWKFLKALLSRDGQNAITVSGGASYPPVRNDMKDPTDPANAWGNGMERFNMSAYTAYPEYTCATEFVAVHSPEYAKDMLNCIKSLVLNYVDNKNYTYQSAMNKCKKSIEAYLSL